jgi:hypothetical protein
MYRRRMASPASARSLAELPLVARNALGFLVVTHGLGFSDEQVSFDNMPSTLRRDEMIACAKLFVDGKGFAFGLGQPIADLDSWVSHARELWTAANRTEHIDMLATLTMFGRAEFLALTRAITEAGIVLTDPPGIVYARLERSGLREVLDCQPGFDVPQPPASRPKPRAMSTPQAPGRPRFTVQEINVLADPHGHLVGVDVDDAIARHAAGDWGECRYVDENERALATRRMLMSVFRTAKGTRFLIITSASHALTTVWPYEPGQEVSEPLLVDVVCRYVGTGRASEIPAPAPSESHFSVFLDGFGDPPGDDEHAASISLFESIVDAAGAAPFRFEQQVWALWTAVYDVDFRPFGCDGQRLPTETDKETWLAAAERTGDDGIRAWFAVQWERRFDA